MQETAGAIQSTWKKRGKRHMLVDGGGMPFAMAIAGINRHDASQLETLLGCIIIERPGPFGHPQNLCLDKGYAGEPVLEAVVLRGFIPTLKAGSRREVAKKKIRHTKPTDGQLKLPIRG